MELFSKTGLYNGDKVFVELEGVTYFGFIVEIDDKFDRIKVDYTCNSIKAVVDWFKVGFWQIVENKNTQS